MLRQVHGATPRPGAPGLANQRLACQAPRAPTLKRTFGTLPGVMAPGNANISSPLHEQQQPGPRSGARINLCSSSTTIRIHLNVPMYASFASSCVLEFQGPGYYTVYPRIGIMARR